MASVDIKIYINYILNLLHNPFHFFNATYTSKNLRFFGIIHLISNICRVTREAIETFLSQPSKHKIPQG